MYAIKICTHFAAAHRLRNYQGKCESLHGHNWKVEVEVLAQDVNDEGMVIDFKALKQLVNRHLERFDHRYLNEIAPFDQLNPTSELLARYLFDSLKTQMPPGVSLAKVTVWESDTACARYWEDNDTKG